MRERKKHLRKSVSERILETERTFERDGGRERETPENGKIEREREIETSIIERL